jgi:hypothetical protein
MVFLLVACSCLVAGAAGVVRAGRMPDLALTGPAPAVPSPSAIAHVYGRRVPAEVRDLALAETVRFSRPA